MFISSSHYSHEDSYNQQEEISYEQDLSTEQYGTNTSYPSSTSENKESVQSQYKNFFGQALIKEIEEFKVENIDKETLQHHKIKIIDENDPYWGKMINHGGFYAENVGSRFYGLQCKYDVLIGRFYLSINVLNLQRNAQSQEVIQPSIGQGSFGLVKIVNVCGKKIAIKRLLFTNTKKYEINLPSILDPTDKSDPFQIRQALKEYSIYKICSMLQIGPQVIFNNVYDLVCYNNGIEFQMQLCQKVQNNITYNYENDIKKCVALLHSIKFIHKDIKPTNTLFSPSLKKYVLSDFGVTHSIKQSISEKTETYFQGSYHYASQQMKKLLDYGAPGKVNLYMNDLNALKLNIDEIKVLRKSLNAAKGEFEQNSQNDEIYSRNSMSFAKYSGGNQYVSNQYNENDGNGSYQFNNGISYNEYNQQYEGTSYRNQQIRKNSSKNNPSSQSNTSQTPLQNQSTPILSQSNISNGENIKYSLEINFYQTQILYYIFNHQTNRKEISVLLKRFSDAKIIQNQKYNPNEIKEIIKGITEELFHNQERKSIIEDVVKSIEVILQQGNTCEKTRMQIRNLIRTFGIYSQQCYQALQKVNQSKQLPYVNYKNLQSSLVILEKYKQSYMIKKFDLYCIDLDKHQRLLNTKSLIKSMKQIFITMNKEKNKQQLQLNTQQKKNIIKGCLLMLGEGEISLPEAIQMKKILSIVYQGGQHTKRQLKTEFTPPMNKSNKQQIKEVCEVLQLIYNILQDINLHTSTFMLAFTRIYSQIDEYKIIGDILYPKINHLWLEISKIFSQNPLQILAKVQLTTKYADVLCYYLQASILLSYFERGNQTALDHVQFVEKLPISLYKILILDRCVHIFIKSENIPIAQKYNQLNYVVKKQYYFPKIHGIEFVYYYIYKVIILITKSQYHLALEYCNKSLNLLSESFHDPLNQKLLIEVLQKMSHCYLKLYDYDKSMKYLQEAFSYAIINKRCKLVERVHMIKFKIMLYLKQGKKQGLIKLFEELLGFQLKLIQQFPDDTGFMKNNIRRLPIFNFVSLMQQQTDLQNNLQIILYAQKVLLHCLEQYLPMFLAAYRELCQLIGNTYIKDSMPSKALPYLWKYLQVYTKLDRYELEIFYSQVDTYANLLINAHADRRAMKFLEKFIFQIPQEYDNIRAEGFKKLHHLSRDLGAKNEIFYNFIWKYKAYRNFENYVACQVAMNKVENKFIKKILQKKLCLIEDFNYRFRQRNSSTYLQDFPQKNLEQETDQSQFASLDFTKLLKWKRSIKSTFKQQ